MEDLWDSFKKCYYRLIREYDFDYFQETSYAKEDLYEMAEEAYVDYKTELTTVLAKLGEVNKNTVSGGCNRAGSSCENRVRLPKIVIPTFSSKYEEWVTCRDMFISVIHNNQNLDHVQILHYLKGYLSGEAEQLLRQIPIMQENYERCWNLFESRYQNKNFLRHNILKRLLKNLFSESASGLKEIVETTTDCLKRSDEPGG